MRSPFTNKPLRRAFALAGATVLAALVLATPASATPYIDRALPAYHDSLTGQTDVSSDATSLRDSFGSGTDENQRDREVFGFVREKEKQTQEEERRQVDYCYWLALIASGNQILNQDASSSDSPEQILVNNLTPCLASRVPALGLGGASITANILAVQNQVHLVQSQSPGLSATDALTWINQNGLTFDPQTWADWFNFVAQNLPPSNTV